MIRPLKTIVLFPLRVLDALGQLYARMLGWFVPNWSHVWLETQANKNRSLITYVEHRTRQAVINLAFYTPNWITRYRARTFSTKEPETLAWLESHGGDGALFDIGANVGLYSIYYSKLTGCRSYSFEPSVFNIPLLTKNINLNGVTEQVKVVANPLSQSGGFATFALSSTDEGGALSAFGVTYGFDGRELQKGFQYEALGFSLDYLRQNNIIPDVPKLIKIDVDGIEHLILEGARQTLSNPRCRSVLIEVSEEFVEQAKAVNETLTACGFILESCHASDPPGTSNQIWIKA